MFTDALTYPFRGAGWIMILIGSVFAVVLQLGSIAPIVGLGVSLFSSGYFSAFYFDIISNTATDHDEVPDWPSFSDFLDDIAMPLLRVIGCVLISFAPLVAVAIFGDHAATWMVAALLAALGFGCFYFPMAILATVVFGGLRGAMPDIVLPAILKSMPGYLGALIALVVVFAMSIAAQEFLGTIPYAGWLLTAAVSLYGLMFQARLIGLLYRSKREVLEWD